MAPPYGQIDYLLKRGEVVPFLGAGVNFGTRTAETESWLASPETSTVLPSGAELSRFLANEASFPSEDDHDRTDLAKVASYFVETSARRRLRERLRDIFNRDFTPCRIHDYLAEIATTKPLLMVTTNYDDLLERACIARGVAYDLVIHPTDRKDVAGSVLWWRHGATEPEAIAPSLLNADLKTRTVIYKMHGTVDRRMPKWDSYVITEDDYVDFLARMAGQAAVPAQFMRHFRTRHFLFLGYSLRDWNLRVVLKNLRTFLPPGPPSTPDDDDDAGDGDDELISWAIQFQPSELERELWGARAVKIYDEDVTRLVEHLREHGAGRSAV